jgi:hypothetical protein
MGITTREYIDQRKAAIKIVVVPLFFAAVALLAHGGKHGPWTRFTQSASVSRS